MPINLSIKNAPDEVVQRLRRRAERHHRSLQGELLAIIEAAALSEQELSPAELLAEVRRLGLNTPANSAGVIRAYRDSH
jgi:antitoxin FitA